MLVGSGTGIGFLCKKMAPQWGGGANFAWVPQVDFCHGTALGGVRKTFKTSKIGLYGFSKKYVLLKDILFLLYMVTESLQRKYKNRVDFSQCCLLFPLSFSESICNTIKGEGVCLGVT